jgi:hypothetical protein
MGDIGYRRKGDSTPLYNPERDYAHITPTLMRIAIETLDAQEPPERVRWRLDNNISQGMVAKIAESLAMAQSDFVNAADPVKNFEDALERHGFFQFDYATRQYLFSAIGEVVCAAWFMAVREVTFVGQEPAAAVDMARFTAAVRSFVSNAGLPTYDINYVAEYRAMQMKTLKAQLESATQEIEKYKSECRRIADTLQTVNSQPAVKPSLFSRVLAFFRKKQNA